jgi:hypothetical protein
MTVTRPALSIRRVNGRNRRSDWLKVPYIVFDGDPTWIPPLLFQEKNRISPRHNPFFSFGDAAFFVAYRGNRPIGRICAQINRLFQKHHGNTTGHFGFFDCCDDAEAAAMLIETAAAWLRSHGSDRMEGPYALSVNEECGLLVEGFDSPAAMLMNQSRPFTGVLLEQAGFQKVMDTFAYRLSPSNVPAKVHMLANHALNDSRLCVRQLDVTKFDEEVRTVIGIFNDAWGENWGFVPFTEAEIVALTKELKPFYRNNYGRIVHFDGQPVAMMLAIPDINELTRSFGGRLLPLNWAKLAMGLWRETFRTARIPLMGIRKAHQKSLNAAAILALLVSDFLKELEAYNLEWVEFSWVLESNKAMNAIGRMAAGEPVKRYRLYTKPLL